MATYCVYLAHGQSRLKPVFGSMVSGVVPHSKMLSDPVKGGKRGGDETYTGAKIEPCVQLMVPFNLKWHFLNF